MMVYGCVLSVCAGQDKKGTGNAARAVPARTSRARPDEPCPHEPGVPGRGPGGTVAGCW
jgi:hypothetical protein